MLGRLKSWFSRGKIEAARKARFLAWCDHAEAVKRGDTRRQNETRRALFAATTEKLKLEVDMSSREPARSFGGVR